MTSIKYQLHGENTSNGVHIPNEKEAWLMFRVSGYSLVKLATSRCVVSLSLGLISVQGPLLGFCPCFSNVCKAAE